MGLIYDVYKFLSQRNKTYFVLQNVSGNFTTTTVSYSR